MNNSEKERKDSSNYLEKFITLRPKAKCDKFRLEREFKNWIMIGKTNIKKSVRNINKDQKSMKSKSFISNKRYKSKCKKFKNYKTRKD